MATIAPAATVIGAAASVGGAIFGGISQSRAASANAAASRAQAELSARQGNANANALEFQGELNAQTRVERAERNVETALERTIRNQAERLRRGEFNAQQFDRAAEDALTQTQLGERQERLRGDMILGQQRAAIGASGVDVEGSPLEVLAFQARENELAAAALRMRGNAQVADLRLRASTERLESQFDAATALMDMRAEAAAELDDARMDAAAMRFDASLRGNAARMGGQAQALSFTSQARAMEAQGSAARTAGFVRAGEAVFNFAGSERGAQVAKQVGSWFG